MSIKINVGGMNYNALSCAQRAEVDNRRKNRLTQVRQQSKEIAQQVRRNVQCEKENQLKRVQAIKTRELNEWKRRTQCEIQQNYGQSLSNFGAAHIAACEASCEEDEPLFQQREEYDLMAAERGRTAMLQEQRKRDREAESRLQQKKRKLQRNAGVQADIVTQRDFSANVNTLDVPDEGEEVSGDEEPAVRVETFVNKRNNHKSSRYDPQKYACNSVDSSNNNDFEEQESSDDVESSELEFNQITNLLKQKCLGTYEPEQVVEISDSSEEEIEVQPPPKLKTKPQPVRKSILKKPPSPQKKLKQKSPAKVKKPEADRVKYIDFSNKHITSYVPNDDLVLENRDTSSSNARTEAKRHEQASRLPSENVLRQLAEIRAKEALEKEKTRRDYERLRLELDEAAAKEKEAKQAAGKALRNITTSQLSKHEQTRKDKMNKAVEEALKRNILTCPPVDSRIPSKVKPAEVNVAAPELRASSSCTSTDEPVIVKSKDPNSEIDNLVKVERLKDLLERINHQKSLLLREIEKSEDIPGPDLEKVIKCLKKLEKEKSALDSRPVEDLSKKKNEELLEREQKLKEREKRLESSIKELYKQQKAKLISESSESVSVNSSDSSTVVPPVEIIIKVQPKKGTVKVRKSIRCVDTEEPGKVYPKTPKKGQVEHEQPKIERQMTQQETQTTPSLADCPKPILKRTEKAQTIANQHEKAQSIAKEQEKTRIIGSEARRKSEDSSISTTYQSLPERISLEPPKTSEGSRKPHHKLNPALMHYITRLLGMNTNIQNQLSVSASTVTTPGSSTINTTGNNGSVSNVEGPCFDDDRLKRLQEFINDNYSFLDEVNETLERSQDRSDKNAKQVEGICRDTLCKKKLVLNEVPAKPANQIKSTKAPDPIFKKPAPPASPPPPAAKLKNRIPAQSQTVVNNRQPENMQQKSNNQLQLPNRNQLQRLPLNRPQQLPLNRPQQLPITLNRPQQPERPPKASAPSRPQITNRDMINVTKYLESHMLNNFTEYTANCQKRIGELAQMMDRVRQEKQKLIENSLSSGEFGHFTEYREIALPGRAQDAQTNSASDLKESPSQPEDPPSEEINNILQKQTRPFGVSKDSGISMSRPVTSSDFRDSPDVRVTSEERENTFQPILRDIPKPPRVRLTPADGESSETVKNISLLIKEQEEKAQKKPPLSLNRFSPHLEKPHEPHELSTIAEVETPSASKVNLLEKADKHVGNIEPFPSFTEYAKNIQPTAQNEEKSFVTLGDVKNAIDEINLKSFIAPRDYGIREMSRGTDIRDDTSQSSTSSSSIIDVIEELRRRNIMTEPFKYVDGDDENSTPPTASRPIFMPQSPRRKQAQTRLLMKTPDNDVHMKDITTPTKRRPFIEAAPVPESPRSNDTLSGIQEIEKEPRDDAALDLQGMGLPWAATMMKRDNASKDLQSSTSSSSAERARSDEIDGNYNKSSASDKSTSSSSIGHPMNLREFLSRELTERSRAKADKSSNDSSLSSQFMRSLLNASSGHSSSGSKLSDRDKLRTSTPVQQKANSTAMQIANTQLFTGDSMSTVKASEGDVTEKSSNSSGK